MSQRAGDIPGPLSYREAVGTDGSIEVIAPTTGVAFTTRRGGVSQPPFDTMNLKRGLGDQEIAVAQNRRLLAEALGITPEWVEAQQVHGCDVLVHVDGRSSTPQADALVTESPHIPLVVFTADCSPVALIGKSHVAAVHVGWRGLVSGIIDRALEALAEEMVEGWIGPTIGACHYEVGPEVPQAFSRRYPSAPAFTERIGDLTFFDLPGATRWVLVSKGVKVDEGQPPCTYCDERFFSYRRDGTTGRQALVVWRVS